MPGAFEVQQHLGQGWVHVVLLGARCLNVLARLDRQSDVHWGPMMSPLPCPRRRAANTPLTVGLRKVRERSSSSCGLPLQVVLARRLRQGALARGAPGSPPRTGQRPRRQLPADLHIAVNNQGRARWEGLNKQPNFRSPSSNLSAVATRPHSQSGHHITPPQVLQHTRARRRRQRGEARARDEGWVKGVAETLPERNFQA